MAIRSKGVNARDKAFTNAYNYAKQRDDLDFYTEMMDYTSQYGYQDLFVQRYNAMDESQRQKIQDLLYNVEDEFKAQTAFQEMTVDLLDNVEKKKFDIVKYDENNDPIMDDSGKHYLEEEVEMTEQEYAKYILDKIYQNSRKKYGYDIMLQQQKNYKDNLEWYHKAVNDIYSPIARFDYGVKESITGLVDVIGSIGYGLGVWVGTGRDGYREYYEKHSLSKQLQEGRGLSLQEYERLYTDYRDVITGDYTTVGKYLLQTVQTVGNMFPYMLVPAGEALGMTEKGAKIFNATKGYLYYASMFGTSQSATINDPDFASVSTLSIIFNGVLKTAAEMAIEKYLSKVLGHVTGLDKRLGTNTSKGMTEYIDKVISKGGKNTSKLTKFFKKGGTLLGHYLGDALHEGLEEGLQEISGMLIDRMFDSKGETFFKEGWNFQNVLDAAIIGAVVSGSMSTVNFITTKRVSTGNMEEVIDKKTGEKKLIEKKLSKSDSVLYNCQLENLYNEYNQLLENAKKTGDADTGAFWAAQAYQTYSILMEYFKGIGVERTQNALKMLEEIQRSSEKHKTIMSLAYVKILTDSMNNAVSSNKIKTSSAEFIEKMKNANITSMTEISKDAVNNMTPEWRKLLQDRWKEHPDFKLMSTDGSDIVVNEDSSLILVPESWFKEGALDVFKTVSEREVVNELYKELNENEHELLETIINEYREWSGDTTSSADKALYSLLYDSKYYSVFMYAHWTDPKAWQIFSRLNDIANSILTGSNIQNSITKLTLKKIERSMKKTLVDLAKHTNVDYEAVTVISEKEKTEIRQSDIRHRGQLIKSVKDIKQKLNLNLEEVNNKIENASKRINSSKREVIDLMNEGYKVLIDPNATRIEIMDATMMLYALMPELFENDTYYISMFTGTSEDNSLPKDIIDILTNESPIDVTSSELSANEKQDILDTINNICYDSGYPKYNATYGSNNQLYVYQNVDVNEVFDQEFIKDPLSYIKNKSLKSELFVIDLISRDFKLSEDSKKLLSATKINITETEELPYYDFSSSSIDIGITEDTDTYAMSKDILNSIYHEVNHAMRAVSSNERYSQASDALVYTKELKEYLENNFKLYIKTQYILEKASTPNASESEIKNRIYSSILYNLDDKEMNAFNTKQVVFISPDEKAKVFMSNGFNYQANEIITPTHTSIKTSISEQLCYRIINAKLEALSNKIFKSDLKKDGIKQEARSIVDENTNSSPFKNTNKDKFYLNELASNQKNAKVQSTYDIEFRNDVYRGVKDIIKQSVPRIYRDTARINDIINDPNKYLSDDVKKEITDTYGSLSKNNIMKYMQKYFYTKYKKTVDITFKDNKSMDVVFINIKNFSEYESDLMKTAKYDGTDNGLTNLVNDYEYTLPSGKRKKGVIPVSYLVGKDHNFGLISRAVVVISDTEGPYYNNGVIVLKSPKNNNDFRYQFAHEFQHLLDDANGLSGGTTYTFEVTSDMVKDLKENVPGYIPEGADVKTQIKAVRDYVYHKSGERKAYGITWLDSDFVHIERKGKYHIAHMPWGGEWRLNEATTQEGRASIILYPERKSVPIGKARAHWLMRNYLKGRTTSIAQTESMTNFIFDLTESDFKKLDVELQDALMSYEMTSAQMLEYVRTAETMNDFTFEKINKHFFGNSYFTSLTQVDEFLKDLSTWHALYKTLESLNKTEEYFNEPLSSKKVHEIIEIIKKDRSLYKKYEKYREDYYKYNDIEDNNNSLRASVIFNMHGTLGDAFRTVANQFVTTKKIHGRSNADSGTSMIKKQYHGKASLNTRNTFSEVQFKAEEIREALALISNEAKAQFISNVYNNPSMYDLMMNAPIEELNAQYINALKRNGGFEIKQQMKDFTEDDVYEYNPTIETYKQSLELLGKRLWRATTKNKYLRDKLSYKFNSTTKGIDFDFDEMLKNGTLTLDILEEMREELAYNLRIAEQILIGRKGGAEKVRYEGMLNIYKKDVNMPNTIRHIIDKTANADIAYTNVQGTDTVEYATKSYKDFIKDNENLLINMIQTPGEVEKVIEYISSDPALTLTSEERQRYQAYTVMMLAWIKNMNLEHGLVLDNYHLELLDKVYNMIGHEWGTIGAALRTAVNLVSPTAYMLQELSNIDGVRLEEQDLVPMVKAMRSGDAQRISEEMAKLEKLIYDRGGDNKMSVLDMFFSIRSSFMLSSPGTWLRNISSNIILRGSMRAASSIGTVIADAIFKKTKGIEERHKLWKIQGTQPTSEVKNYSKSIFEGDLYELVREGLNKYKYNEDKGPYKKNKKGEVKLDENGEPIINLNNNMYAQMIVETIKRRFFGATSFEDSMKANKALKRLSVFGKMMDKANNFLQKVLSDEKYIKARASYYFDRMLTESIQRGDISELKLGVLTEKIATILAQAFTEACADYMHKGSFLKDFENILYKKYNKAKTTSAKFGYGAAYSIWKFLLPYANAGWNWFSEGVKYTPAGIVSGVFKLINLEKDIQKNPNNKMLAFRAKQDLGKGVLGTTIMGIAIALAQAGLIGYDDEDGTVIIGNYKLDISALFGSPAFATGLILGSTRDDYDLMDRLHDALDLSLDGFFLVDFIDSLSYTSGGWEGFLSNTTENLIQSLIPNVWKTMTNLFTTGKYKTPYGFAGIFDRFMISLLGPLWGDSHAEKRIDAYTGEEISKWDLPIWSRIGSLGPVKIGKREMSDVEKFSLEHGVAKSESSAKFNDEESGKWSYDYDDYNRYRGKLNNLRVTEFMNDISKYEVTRGDKKLYLKCSQMTDEEITKILQKIYNENTKYTKIWAWTQLGNKYYATEKMYIELKKLGIQNVYLKSGKYSGYVKK